MTVDRPAASSAEPADEALMRRYQGGDAQAFELLYRRHKRPVFNFCLRMTGHRERAADAMQEIFTKVIKASLRWTEQAKFTTWMYTIARNHLADLAKKKKETLDGKEREIAHEVVHGDPSLRDALNRAISALPPEQREVFLLRSYAEMKFEEVANIVGVPTNTAKSRMRLAVKGLRAHLERQGVVPS